MIDWKSIEQYAMLLLTIQTGLRQQLVLEHCCLLS